ncbi:phage head morphogenesis protein [Cypionkella psychrotolerans]|uniref:phage head morphogenesis protein n=1 Tax=Cypionkella psychrotolerans TaxID=1678131 RepID=UPI0006B67F32|nr:phage minor head protein [Cypionkella psychrotolerans]
MTISATFGKPFAYQVAAFRLRLAELKATAKWDDVWQSEHDRAFMVAGALKADLLADLAAAVDKSISQGGTLQDFRRDFRKIVEERGWHGWTGEGTKGGEAWRTRVIYRTNMATSYAAGRYAQLTEGSYAFWIYFHGNSLEPRLQHLAWDGLILPPDHPFWATHFPPNGWGCSCRVSGARSMASAVRRGGKADLKLPSDWAMISSKTGAPMGISKGWAYAPGRSVANDVAILAAKLPDYPAPIGAALAAALPPAARDEIGRQFGEFLDQSLSSYVQQKHMIIGALDPSWIAAAQKHNIEIASAEIAVVDRDIQHTFRGTPHVTTPSTKRANPDAQSKVQPLDIAWYRGLPAHLRVPDMVYLDMSEDEPVFVLIFDRPDDHAKLVIKINVYAKKADKLLNTVRSGRIVTSDDIAAQLGEQAILIKGRGAD